MTKNDEEGLMPCKKKKKKRKRQNKERQNKDRKKKLTHFISG